MDYKRLIWKMEQDGKEITTETIKQEVEEVLKCRKFNRTPLERKY